jgi:hypothetical protein
MKIPKIVNIFVIQINYKSGISVVGNYRKFDGDTKGNDVTSLKWVSDGSGRPIFMNISEIESIHQLRVKKRLRWVEL